jgi:hypothetical protein
MSSLLDRKDTQCDRFQAWLEESASPQQLGAENSVELSGLERGLLETYVSLLSRAPAELHEHAKSCSDCREAAEDVVALRNLVNELEPAPIPTQWFAPRVMAAIASLEAERSRVSAIWLAVPRFASRLSWIAAAALLVTCTWLYERPTPPATAQTASAYASEHLFDPPAISANHDDVLVSLNEKDR